MFRLLIAKRCLKCLTHGELRYDKEKKQIRQKSKYLGKNINGVPVKVRSCEKITKKALSHGEFIPLKKIAEDLMLEKLLSDVLPDKEVRPTLALAMN